MTHLDVYFFQQLNQFAGKWLFLDNLAVFFAKYLGYFLVLILFLFLAVNFRKYRLMVVKGLGAAVLARFIIVEIIRYFLPRPRPFVENHINLLLDKINQLSFPSGHAAFHFALSAIIYHYNKKAGIGFFIASFLMCLARVFVGVHWPSDILAGAAVGIFSAWLIMFFSRKFFPNTEKQKPQLK